MSIELKKANEYEKTEQEKIPVEEKPAFHVAAPVGWINDPNGFSWYQGQIHLFYQYHPYTTEWGPMHWGHSVSDDMIHWKNMPSVLAPDQEYDKRGCFSGSATEKDGKHVLIYTGVSNVQMENGSIQERQNQCIAYGDGEIYVKSPQNPVITGDMLPADCSKIDFRDPKVWKKGKNYYLIVGNKNSEQKGQVVLFSSKNLEKWKFETVLAENSTGQIGTMWECPDFFELDGTHFLICSPQNMKAQKYEFHNGNNSVYFSGKYNETEHTFQKEAPKSLDYGLDFYAPQTTKLPDGRRILIAWMKSWDACVIPDGQKWQGMMTLPRELRYMNGRLYQNPVEELKQYRKNPCCLKDQEISGTVQFDEVRGRMLDLTVEIENGQFDEFCLELAHNMEYTTTYTYNRKKQIMEVDRTCCGVTKDVICRRIWKVTEGKETLKLRFILDRQSIELFVNDGEQVVTTAICTPIEADEIVFSCDGNCSLRRRENSFYSEEFSLFTEIHIKRESPTFTIPASTMTRTGLTRFLRRIRQPAKITTAFGLHEESFIPESPKKAVIRIEIPAEAISATTAGRSIPRIPCRVSRFRYLIYRYAIMVTMMQEGRIHPRVATSAPGIPAILIPTKVAELMAIGPGVIWEMVIRSVNSAIEIQ